MFHSGEQGIRQLPGIYSIFLLGIILFKIVLIIKVICGFCREFRNNRKIKEEKKNLVKLTLIPPNLT